MDSGEIPAYRIGGTFLRFRKEQIDAVKEEVSTGEEEKKALEPDSPRIPYETKAGRISQEPIAPQFDYTSVEKIKDFFYFYDFYIFSFIVILLLLYLIFKS